MEKPTDSLKTPLTARNALQLIKKVIKKAPRHRTGTWENPNPHVAYLDAGEHSWVTTQSLLTEQVHFNLSYFPLQHLGYKSVVVGISNLLAANASPQQVLLTLGVSNRFTLEALEAFYEGVLEAIKHYQIDLASSQITASATGLQIAVTSIGGITRKQRIPQQPAEGDLICVTGDLGGAYLGLKTLQREKHIFSDNQSIQPDFAGFEYVLERQLRPLARVELQATLEEADIQPTTMAHVGEGLIPTLFQLIDAEQGGVALDEKDLPIAQTTYNAAMSFHLDPTMCACHGGEDYELLFTAPPKDQARIEAMKGVQVIGKVTAPHTGYLLHTKGGNQVPLEAPGWSS